MFFLVRSTISVGGSRALDEVCTSYLRRPCSRHQRKHPSVGWLFSQLKHDGKCFFKMPVTEFNVFLIFVSISGIKINGIHN